MSQMKSVISIATFYFVICFSVSAANPPIMGWSSWNTYRVNISDSLILSQAQAMVALGLDSVGYRYVNIDDGFFGGRDSYTKKLKIHPERFPLGMKPVVEGIHSLGLKAGIYSDAGLNTCGNFWDNDTIASDVGLYTHESQDCQFLFGDLNFDFIKVDFCGGDSAQNIQRLSLDPEERYRSIRASIDSVGRSDVKLNVCRWNFPGTWVCDMASSWRISADISANWESVKSIINENLYLSAYASPGHYNDMDMLELGRGLTHNEERTHMAMWCMLSSPLLIGCNLLSLSESTLNLLKNQYLISINQDTAAPQAYVVKQEKGTYVLVRDINKKNGLTRAIAFYNPTDSVVNMNIDWGTVGLLPPIVVYNAIEQKKECMTHTPMHIAVEPHNTHIYIVTGNDRIPQTVYEAETAFLTSYQELDNPEIAGTAYYAQFNDTPEIVGAHNIGGNTYNDVIWNNVIVPDTGKYNIRINYASCTGGEFFIETNGKNGILTLNSDNPELESTDMIMELKEGGNKIRLWHPHNKIGFIDNITVTPAR